MLGYFFPVVKNLCIIHVKRTLKETHRYYLIDFNMMEIKFLNYEHLLISILFLALYNSSYYDN